MIKTLTPSYQIDIYKLVGKGKSISIPVEADEVYFQLATPENDFVMLYRNQERELERALRKLSSDTDLTVQGAFSYSNLEQLSVWPATLSMYPSTTAGIKGGFQIETPSPLLSVNLLNGDRVFNGNIAYQEGVKEFAGVRDTLQFHLSTGGDATYVFIKIVQVNYVPVKMNE